MGNRLRKTRDQCKSHDQHLKKKHFLGEKKDIGEKFEELKKSIQKHSKKLDE